MRLISSLTVLLLLSACANIEPQYFRGPNGKSAYTMQCSGMGRTLSACYQKAGEVCPMGYTVVDRATGIIAMPAYGGGTMAAPKHTLAIECK